MLRGRTSYIGQPPSSPPTLPTRIQPRGLGRRGESGGVLASLTRWLRLAIGVTLFIFLCLASLAIVFGVLQARDQRRYERTRNDIEQLRGGLEPIGFLARKRGTQTIVVNAFTTVTSWGISGGAPAYDDSNGALNFASGIWTSPGDAKYQVSASICWTNGALGLRQMIILTNLTGGIVPLTSTVAAIGVICNSLSVNMDLPQGTTVQIQALRSTVGVEIIGTSSTFGIERIGAMEL